jgi:hypothetical protein
VPRRSCVVAFLSLAFTPLQVKKLESLEEKRKAGNLGVGELKTCEAYSAFAEQFVEVRSSQAPCASGQEHGGRAAQPRGRSAENGNQCHCVQWWLT